MRIGLAIGLLLVWGCKDKPPEPPAKPLPESQVGSPYSPEPMSFPKMLGGIIYFEDSVKGIRVSQDQATKLLGPVRRLSEAWQGALKAENDIKTMLTCDQLRYIGSNKPIFERSDSPSREHAGKPRDPFIIYEVQEAARILEERAKEEGGPEFVPCPPEEQNEGPKHIDMGGSLYDAATGILMMEEDKDLRVFPSQARLLSALFQGVMGSLRTTGRMERKMRSLLTREQIDTIKRDIVEVVNIKQRWAGGMGGTGPDPLSARVLEILEARAEGRPVPPREEPPSREVPPPQTGGP